VEVCAQSISQAVGSIEERHPGRKVQVVFPIDPEEFFDGGYPQEAVQGNGSRLTWQASWAAGVATNADIEEVVIVNDTLADATSAAGDTLSRAIISQVNKGASDTLTVTRTWEIGA
jgi:hypothetical protein